MPSSPKDKTAESLKNMVNDGDAESEAGYELYYITKAKYELAKMVLEVAEGPAAAGAGGRALAPGGASAGGGAPGGTTSGGGAPGGTTSARGGGTTSAGGPGAPGGTTSAGGPGAPAVGSPRTITSGAFPDAWSPAARVAGSGTSPAQAVFAAAVQRAEQEGLELPESADDIIDEDFVIQMVGIVCGEIQTGKYVLFKILVLVRSRVSTRSSIHVIALRRTVENAAIGGELGQS